MVRAPTSRIGAELAVVHRRGRVDRRFNGKHFAGHADVSIEQSGMSGCTSSMRLMTVS